MSHTARTATTARTSAAIASGDGLPGGVTGSGTDSVGGIERAHGGGGGGEGGRVGDVDGVAADTGGPGQASLSEELGDVGAGDRIGGEAGADGGGPWARVGQLGAGE